MLRSRVKSSFGIRVAAAISPAILFQNSVYVSFRCFRRLNQRRTRFQIAHFGIGFKGSKDCCIIVRYAGSSQGVPRGHFLKSFCIFSIRVIRVIRGEKPSSRQWGPPSSPPGYPTNLTNLTNQIATVITHTTKQNINIGFRLSVIRVIRAIRG